MDREEFLEAVEILKCLFEGEHITIELDKPLELFEEVCKYRKEHPEEA